MDKNKNIVTTDCFCGGPLTLQTIAHINGLEIMKISIGARPYFDRWIACCKSCDFFLIENTIEEAKSSYFAACQRQAESRKLSDKIKMSSDYIEAVSETL